MKDIFISGHWEKNDYLWLGYYTVLLLLAVVTRIISPSETWGQVYSAVGYLTFAGLLAGIMALHNRKLPFVAVGISGGKFWYAVGGGLVVAMFLVGKSLFGMKSFLNPLMMPTLSIGMGGALGTAWLLGQYASEMEETFRENVVRPFLANWTSQMGLGLTLFIIASLVYFVAKMQLPGLVIGALGVAIIFKKDLLGGLLQKKIFVQGISILGSASIFGIMHYMAYGGVVSAMMSAMIFALIVSILNQVFQNTIASRVAHATNNSVLAMSMVGVAPVWGLAISGAYIMLLYFLRTGSFKVV